MRSGYFVALLVLVTYSSAKISPENHKDDLSSKEHYKDGMHDARYDHDAFLGEEMAQEWEKLRPSEVKRRLRHVKFISCLFLCVVVKWDLFVVCCNPWPVSKHLPGCLSVCLYFVRLRVSVLCSVTPFANPRSLSWVRFLPACQAKLTKVRPATLRSSSTFD